MSIPLVPAGGKNKADYMAEITVAGFAVDDFIEMDKSSSITHSATMYVHKVKEGARYD